MKTKFGHLADFHSVIWQKTIRSFGDLFLIMARTRTLIQLGGLLSLTPILEICNIRLGEDLQISSQDKADTLLGILSSLFDSLSDNFDGSDLEHFKHIGSSLRISHETNR